MKKYNQIPGLEQLFDQPRLFRRESCACHDDDETEDLTLKVCVCVDSVTDQLMTGEGVIPLWRFRAARKDELRRLAGKPRHRRTDRKQA